MGTHGIDCCSAIHCDVAVVLFGSIGWLGSFVGGRLKLLWVVPITLIASINWM